MAGLVSKRDVALGPLQADGFAIHRSGLRWLVADGHRCRAGEPVANCYVGLRALAGRIGLAAPFAKEHADLQVTLAAPSAGVLRHSPDASRGGWLDQLDRYQHWDPHWVAGSLEGPVDPEIPLRWRLTFMAGERMTELAEDRSGLLTGWRRYRRAWHGESSVPGTLLSLGVCEQNGVFLGERHDFAELLQLSPGALHVVHVGDETLVPSAAILADRMRRDLSMNAQVAAEMTETILRGPGPPGPADLIFAGSALAALTRCPLRERYDLLSTAGVLPAAGVQAVVLSVQAEPKVILRHRKLGYRAFWHRFRVDSTGQATRSWLNVSFEPLVRTVEDIKADLLALRQLLADHGITHVLIMNALSSAGEETIFSYAPFSKALGDELSSVRAKELNLMLHDLGAQTDVAIVDVDAVAAGLGAAVHLPDGIHQSGPLQDEIRQEILHILERRRFFVRPGRRASNDARAHIIS